MTSIIPTFFDRLGYFSQIYDLEGWIMYLIIAGTVFMLIYGVSKQMRGEK